MSDIKCTICNSESIKVALKLESPLGGLWDIHECENCAIQFTHPIPSQEELSKFYEVLYAGGSSSRPKSLVDPLAGQTYWQRQWKIIKNLNGNNSGRVLDFGYSGGHFLDNAGNSWEKFGVELSKEAREVAKKKGVKSFKGLRQADFLKGFFEVVTMFAAIEHLPNPRDEVEELAKALKTGEAFRDNDW